MSFTKFIQNNIFYPCTALAKALLLSGKPFPSAKSPQPKPLVIMGNGPSLRQFLPLAQDVHRACNLMALNFAAMTPEFTLLKPDLYILADPHFFRLPSSDTKVTNLWKSLHDTSWPMVLFLPAREIKRHKNLLNSLPGCISVQPYNLTPMDGTGIFQSLLCNAGLAMPRPRNVLIPAIVNAIRFGFREIYLTGADHTWHSSLWVDDQNHVVSVQPHFYQDNEEERKRVTAEYAGYHLHHILHSLTVAFRSYHEIANFANYKKASIFNATPGSFIDAFPRRDAAQIPTIPNS